MNSYQFKILLVEANPDDSRKTVQILDNTDKARFQTIAASSIDEALISLRKNEFDAILFAPATGDSNSPASMGRLRAAVPDIPLIVLMDQRHEILSAQILKSGVHDCLIKGDYDNHLLVASLLYVIAMHKLAQSEGIIRKKEAELADTQQLARLGNWRWDIPKNKLSWSDELFRICGLIPQGIELTRESFYDHVHPDDLERVRGVSEKARNDHQPYSHKFRIIRPDGSVRFVHSIGKPVVDKAGTLVALFGTVQDITEEKSFEEKLQESVNLLRAILEETTDTIFIKDLQGRYLLVNEIGARNFGKTPQELIGHDNSILDFPPETAKQIEQTDRQVILTGETATYEIKVNIEGVKRTFLSTKGPYRDHSGKTIGVIGITRDITERKLMEEKLRTEHAFRKPLEDSMLAGVVAVDLNGQINYVNPSFCRMVGWKEEELIGSTPPHPFWPPEDITEILKGFKKRLTTTESRQVEYRFRRKNKEYFQVLVSSSPLTDGHGNHIGFLSTFHDITDRKKAEDALATEKERLSVTLGSIVDCILTTDVQGKINLMNKAAEVFIGYKTVEMYGKPFSEIFNVIDERSGKPCQDIVAEVLDAGQPVDPIEGMILLTRKGDKKIIEIGASPIHDQQKKIIGVVAVFRDITERKKLRQELQKVQKLESLGILAGGIAHDFNNLLTGILGNISLAKTYVEPGNRVFERLNEAEKASLRATELSRQLLTFARGGVPVKQLSSIEDILEHSVQFALRGSNIQSKFVFEKGLWPVEIDEGQIGQVIQNLVINAQQAMPDGGTITIKVSNLTLGEKNREAFSLRKGNYVEISIHDEGVGIPKEILSKIFDPYFTTKQTGSGLGLAISHSIIQRHDGVISVKSEAGAGATFFLYLPAFPQASVPQKDEKEGLVKGTGRVLIMDDEQSVLNVAGEMLKVLGYDVDKAPSGTKAMQQYIQARDSGQPFDLVISDLTVPGDFGGVILLERLKKIDPEVKVIVSSGYSNDSAIADFKAYGFTDFIMKPYRVSELSKTLQRVFGRE